MTFANANNASTTAAFSVAGTYTLRLTATDSALTSSDDVSVTVNAPANQPPVVSAGADETITLPANANLTGIVTDDGLPQGGSLTVLWSKLSGPGNVSFSNAASLTTTASFSVAGTYILRLTASDSVLISSDDVTITVNPATVVNQPPTVNAGTDKTVYLEENLIKNPGNESPLVNGKIASWVEVDGSWSQANSGTGNQLLSIEGNAYFSPGDSATAELRQDINVSAYTAAIEAGNQFFEFSGFLHTSVETPADTARIIIEYRDADNSSVIDFVDSGPISNSYWYNYNDFRFTPPGTCWIRIRLISTRNSGASNDAYFDNLTLHAYASATVELTGTVSDDGLPAGSSLSTSWIQIDGPTTAIINNSNSANTSVSFIEPGTYVFKLTADDSEFTSTDEVTVTVNNVNQYPEISFIPFQQINAPENSVTFNPTITDDGLPVGSDLTIRWELLEGDGTVTFSNPDQAATTATFSQPGFYFLQISVSDSDHVSTRAALVYIYTPPVNQAPVVNAGQDITIALPSHDVGLQGSVSDDGLPSSTLTVSWTKVSGPGEVTFSDPNYKFSDASFSEVGTYVLRLTATDTEFTTSDDVVVTVEPDPTGNQPPVVNAGADQTVTIYLSNNLIQNGGNEAALVNGEIPGWTEVEGTGWTKATAGVNGYPNAVEGETYFFAGFIGFAELRQDINLSNYAAAIANGTQQFQFKGYLNGAFGDFAGFIVEYRDASNSNVLGDFAYGPTNTNDWTLVTDTRTAPVGTGWVRIRMLAYGNGSNDAYFDALSFSAISHNTVNLNGMVSDDGLPAGGTVTSVWSKQSGPGDVIFTDPNNPTTTATLSVPGTYVLRLTADDTRAQKFDDVVITVNVGDTNLAPVVNAGADQSISLPATATLNGTATDDGLPPNSTLSYNWSKVSGPGAVTFSSANSLDTTASFTIPGSYLLRLTVSDGELNSSDDLTITVYPTNQAPVVNAGADQTISQLISATLTGTATDDGLPPNSTLSYSWSKVSGPGTATFVNANAASTTVSFSDGGSYQLRLTVSDGSLSSADDLVITVIPAGTANQAPVVNAGADQTITLPISSVTLTATASDDSLPPASQLTYSWTQVSGPCQALISTPNQLSTSVAFTTIGSYTFRITVSDSALASSDDVVINLLSDGNGATNRAPGVDAGPDQQTRLNLTITLTGTALDDSLPTNTLTYSWTQISGPTGVVNFGSATQASTTVSFGTPGNYLLKFTVSDGEQQSSDYLAVKVLPNNEGPRVYAGPDQSIDTAITQLNGRAFDDEFPLGRVLTYTWSKLSGPGTVSFSNPSSLDTTASFSALGLYTVRLVVSDGALASASDVNINIGSPGVNQAPVVSGGADQVVRLPQIATLRGSVVDDGLPGGSHLVNSWISVSGPAAVTIVYGSEDRTIATAEFTAPGTYVLRFSSTDSQLTASDDVTVVVTSAANLDLTAGSLTLSNVTINGQTLAFQANAQVSITNLGNNPIGDSFTIKFFEDRNGNGQFDATDNVLGTVTQNGIGAQTSLPITAALQGTLLFHSNLIFAFVDADNVITEDSETNNLANTVPPCTFQPSTGAFAPVLKWSWSGSAAVANEAEVIAAPVVADINGDGVADVIFTAIDNTVSRPDAGLGNAHIHVLNGRDGSELLTITSRNVWGTAGIAVGDIDRDGRPEIIAVQSVIPGCCVTPDRLIAFNHDGTVKWIGAQSEFSNIDLGAPSIVDLDNDGLPEIVLGRQVFNNDGTLRWTGTAGKGGNTGNYGVVSISVDLDLDGQMEVVAGNTAYRKDGSIYWQQTSLADGATAIGNFDADPFPEVVLVSYTGFHVSTPAQLTLLEHDGTIKWGPIPLPFNGGGPPLVADLDGDGIPEIGIATTTKYLVYNADGTLKWSIATQDLSSGITSSTAFDFDGDGKAEVVYSDELKLRILRGTDGAVLYEYPLGSLTGIEYPVVADIDGDGKAEIVAVANHLYSQPGIRGIFAFEDSADKWVTTRSIWNQHSYHITNVNDDGTIPAKEQNSLEVVNGFRTQALVNGCAYAQPDIIPSYVRRSAVGQQIKLTARIGNGGGIAVGSEVPVSFYNGDPSDGGSLLGTARTSQYLAPGKFEDVSILMPQETIALPIWVVADDQGGLHGSVTESNETNNRYNSNLFLSPLANHAPIVNAGPDQTRTLSTEPVILAGEVHDDGLPLQSYTTFWGVVSGPGPVTFEDATNAATSATFTVAGTYVLRLTADDGQLSGKDELIVTINALNQAPIVIAGTDLAIKLNQSADLNGEVNDDKLPNDTLTISWSKLSGAGTVTFANAAIKHTTATFSAAGTYVLKLEASDGELQSSDTVTVTVNTAPDNQAPTVNAGADQSITLPVDTLQINGQVLDDGNPNNSLQVSWQQLDGPATVTFGSLQQSGAVTATFSQAGTYTLRLTANDGDLSSSDDVQVTVNAAGNNQAPTVNAGADQSITLPTNSVTLQGTFSDDGLPTSQPLRITWTAVSGPGTVSFSNQVVTGSTAAITATFSVAGNYTLRLIVNDSQLISSDDVLVSAISTVGAPPVVNISSPADGAEITKPTDIIGTVTSVGAVNWQMQYALHPDEDDPTTATWISFANGTGNVNNAKLGTLDTTMMLNGIYGIRVVANDEAGQISIYTISGMVTRNLKVGNFAVSFTDLSIPVQGIPIQVIRSYDSRDKRQGDFGIGWTLDLKSVRVEKNTVTGKHWAETMVYNGGFPSYTLDELRPNFVTVTFPNGKVYKFRAVATPHGLPAEILYPSFSFVPEAGTQGKLEALDASDLRIVGDIPEFGQPARSGLVQIVNLLGSGMPYNPRLFKFTTPEGVEFVIDEQLGLQSVKDIDGNILKVETDGIKHYVGGSSVPNQSVIFTRDAQGRITKITDPKGNPQNYSYDTNGNLATFTDAENHVTTFSYNNFHQMLSIKDPRNITPITNEYDADGRLIKHTDSNGKEIIYTHDIAGRKETIKDRLGNPTTYTYDERGNVLQTKDPLNAVTTYTYDSNDNQLSVTNALGKTSTATFDGFDNKVSKTDSLGNTTTYSYNGFRKVLTITDPRGAVTVNSYNTKGRLTATRDALGNTSSNVYNSEGQITSTTDANGKVTSYTYDNLGRLTNETDALNHVRTYGYDTNGNRISETETRTVFGAAASVNTTFEYDKLNRVVKTNYPDRNNFSGGDFTTVEYNAIGKQSKTIDQAGRITSYTYDSQGQLTRSDYPDGTFDETTYDAEGRRVTSKDRAGRITSFTYDNVGRLTQTTYSDTTITITSYDILGRVLTSKDTLGHITTYEYDPNCGCSGRRTKVIDAAGNVTNFAYDTVGNQISITDANNHTTYFDYDLNNRQTRVRYADNTQSTTQYDKLGRRVSQTDQAGKSTSFTYDDLGRLVKVTDALGQQTTYSYDDAGQQLTQTDTLNRTTSYQYDLMGRRFQRKLPLGQIEQYFYNITGTVREIHTFSGGVNTFSYDIMNRLVARNFSGFGAAKNFTYTYTATGQRASVMDNSITDNTGTIIYSYDERDRLIRKQGQFGALSYSYDAAGNLVSVRSNNAEGVSVDYGYDGLNRLQTVTDNRQGTTNNITAYEYDRVGNLAKVELPNGVESSYQYNALNRLTQMNVKKGVSGLTGYAYTLGAAGNRLAVSELSGRSVQWSYDALYRLTSETIAGSNNPGNNGSISYTYDKVGNRLQRNSLIADVPVQQSTYDNNDRLASDSYDATGNTISSGNRNYLYDGENHLVDMRDASTGISVHIVYDADGNRISKTVGPKDNLGNFIVAQSTTTNYLVDSNNLTGYAQVVEELVSVGGAAPAGIRQYTYGLDLLSQRQLINGSWITSWYQYDGHGSVRGLLAANGSLTNQYDYDAYGVLINQVGNTPNNYLYAGEQWDPDLQMYYNRARYLNVSTGRFWTQDSYEGHKYDPKTLHKYLYCNGNPVNRNDPSGRATGTIIGDLVLPALIDAILVTLALISIAYIHDTISDKIKSDEEEDDEDYLYFYHGTTLEFAADICAYGLNEDRIKANLIGTQGQKFPGSFFVFPDAGDGFGELAAGVLAARDNSRSIETIAVMRGKIPRRVFDYLYDKGEVYVGPYNMGAEEWAFHPPSFAIVDAYKKGEWLIFPLLNPLSGGQ